jgi:hypothetical protein
MLAWAIKTFSAKKAEKGLVVINGILAVGANIFAHVDILLLSKQLCQGVKSYQKTK